MIAFTAANAMGGAVTLVEAEEKAESPVSCSLNELASELELTVQFAEDKTPDSAKSEGAGADDGGYYSIYLDGMIVMHDSYAGKAFTAKKSLALSSLFHGAHDLNCEVRTSSGDTYNHKVGFVVDASPHADITGLSVNRKGELHGNVSLHFVGGSSSGFLDIFINDHPVIAGLAADATSEEGVPLSQIAGESLSVADLVLGTHLLKMTARGAMGGETTVYRSFTLDILPELKLVSGHENRFEHAECIFLQRSRGYSGIIEIFADQNLVYSKPAVTSTVVISREDIAVELEKLGEVQAKGPITLVFVLRAANGSEHWQKIDFL